jgi:hypothetical protein
LKEPDEQLIRAELVKFAAAMPAILSVSVVDRTVNGWTVAFVSRDDSFNPGFIDAMINDHFRLAIEFINDFSLGDFKYFTSISAEVLGIILPLTEFYGMVLVLQAGTRLDKLLATIKPYCQSLLPYLPD